MGQLKFPAFVSRTAKSLLIKVISDYFCVWFFERIYSVCFIWLKLLSKDPRFRPTPD